MSDTIQPGELVQLNSGRPVMTVQHDVNKAAWYCHWFDGYGKLNSGSFLS
ncbi:MAG: DUF2158 domain-containing protein [Gemmatimonadaceae bacterium]